MVERLPMPDLSMMELPIVKHISLHLGMRAGGVMRVNRMIKWEVVIPLHSTIADPVTSILDRLPQELDACHEDALSRGIHLL